MTEVRVGQRVKGTTSIGSVIEGEVKQNTFNGIKTVRVTEGVSIYLRNLVDVEIIAPPLPTEPGLYAIRYDNGDPSDADLRVGVIYRLFKDGTWYFSRYNQSSTTQKVDAKALLWDMNNTPGGELKRLGFID